MDPLLFTTLAYVVAVGEELKQIVPGFPTLKNAYTLLWDMGSNEGYIKIVAMMQKYFDQAISGKLIGALGLSGKSMDSSG